MHAASREALERLSTALDKGLNESNETVGVGAVIGSELFDIVDILDSDRTLRVAMVDQSKSPAERSALAENLFGGKASATTVENVSAAVAQTWSNSRDFRAGLVQLGRRALLRSAEGQGQLDRVEDELFRLARIIEREPQLELLLADRAVSADARRDLLAKVLYGKVTSVTEALALQAVGRLQQRPVEELDALCDEVAQLKGAEVARVRAAAPLGEQQQSQLADKLEKIYGRKISVHTEVDSSLLGGAVIRVGDEVIDGSTAGKLQRLRRSLV
ncbi:F0F1 ATP synthase subunit delta [Corynebacterium sp. 320]|uniref:ATP synthase subunit delta n=1 Tax=Corynebacterium zhongnanshanii TaxID=2768834 RepID=A0ABQ6VFY2_9CORY|nr:MULTISPECIES: F0F1 ATP synthase subunit delta [Corynebacterium]KAB1503937.1 F0F1 ATP synthase subunit delta [Corynebacterium sp. 320]KAB1552964.1 F0F1 ATP synthase subunit delta [Corynebacterium sp. 321]KAB1553816.1 F0F1 ATP synthase subunit delta [Corynebacterium sp. 319]KAB3523213.1 F0F1 ATP synthase subunit delta [Corynebacterium zhongnanshanii]KAB3528073.1 F0F1 ATP synthase subunit delta [Corynebacterium sp. 250]